MHLNLPRKVHCSQSWPDGCYRTHIATVYYISRPPLSQNPPSALDKLTIKITKIIFNILFSGIRFWKSFPVKFIQLLIFFESTNLCRDKMWKWSLQIYISGTLFMLFAAVLLFIWVILSLGTTHIIHLLGSPSFICLFLGKFMILHRPQLFKRWITLSIG